MTKLQEPGCCTFVIEGTKTDKEKCTMSTFMANKGNIVRKWYVVDAAGKPLGHTAVVVADLLRGKVKPNE